MARKNVNTTLDEDLWKEIRLLALNLGNKGANDLLEEGMKYILHKYTSVNRPNENIKRNEHEQ